MSVRLIAMSALLIAGSSVALQAEEVRPGVTRADLQRHDLSIPRREVVQATIALAPAVTTPDHSHPGEEIIYVPEGTFEYRVSGTPIRLEPGGVLSIPAAAIYSATNIGPGNAVELATYIVEKGRPLIVPAR